MIKYAKETKSPAANVAAHTLAIPRTPTGRISFARPARVAQTPTDRVAHADACRAWARRITADVGAAKGRPAPGTPPRIILRAGDTVTLTARGARLNRAH